MRLIIIGPMASGKSVVGKKLSKRLNLNFFDTDEEIVNKTGVTISHIFMWKVKRNSELENWIYLQL